MGLESSEEIELYKALIAAREKYSRMQTRLIKEQAIMIELLEERNAALETKLCELILEKERQKKRITPGVIVEISGNRTGFRGEQQIERRGGLDEKSHYIRNV